MKCDEQLGLKVQQHLISKGIETPMITPVLTENEQIDTIKEHVYSILTALNLDLTDDSLQETPIRVAKMYVKEIFAGLNYKHFPKCTVIENKMSCADEFILVKNITLQSSCEHHLLPILNLKGGGCHVAYIPKDKVIGLSKLNRIVKFFARRPQVQERLTHQIMEALCFILGTDDVAVEISADHMCVMTRGVEDATSTTTTAAMNGRFRTDSVIRSEFFSATKA
jgi:GTP cyclohydrolase I